MRFRNLAAGLLFSLAAVAPLATACGDDPGGADNSVPGNGSSGTHSDFTKTDRLRVATTVAPLTSIVLNVGGDRVYIHALIPDGVDSHTFEPKPSAAAVLSRADLLIVNGAHLEGTIEEIAKQHLHDSSKIYRLADNTLQGEDEQAGFLYDFSFPRAEGSPNPHLWMNPKYALRYADLVRTWLSENDPKNADYYARNSEKLAAVLNQLDDAIRKDAATVPENNRKLLTYHDSWAYWAREYDWRVVGAIQPSDFSEPSARDVADLISQIKSEKVPAIFGSEVFPSKTLQTIAAESGAQFEERLRDDEPPGNEADPGHTYVGMLVEDMKILFTRLGGKADTVSGIPVANTFER
jgi:manganese/iron transport system substrate-binding protein